MNREDAMRLSETAIQDLATQIEQGKSDTLLAYLDAMARFHDYSFGNVLLIACQNPGATHVAGFHAWRKLGRWVRKGERGIVILAPLVYRAKREEQVEATEYSTDATRQCIHGFKAVHVFDVTQTEGTELPRFAEIEGEAGQVTAKLLTVIADDGISITQRVLPGGVLGASAGGHIYMAPNLSPAKEFAVLVHEFAHELLHRGKQGTSKTVIETEAEAVAYVVCRAVGLEPNTSASDYIQLYNGTKATLAASLDTIQKTATAIVLKLRSDG